VSGVLAGKAALVTGGAQGIGLGIARELAVAGARVALADRNLDAARASAVTLIDEGLDAVAVRIDVTDQASVDAGVAETIELLGAIDILANNAGIHVEALDRLSTIEDFQRVFDVNLYGIWRVSQAVASHFRTRGGGKIVNTASINGRRPWAQTPAYSASKAGVINLTQALAVTLGPDGITVNAVCPGSVVTPMADQFFADLDAFRERAMEKRAIKREVTPATIGQAVVFFASSAADVITGQSLNVDGGVEFD
jgi:NAD(P)-dependent dehydrogenase (short-subunit alcohol dehydrogenase family)